MPADDLLHTIALEIGACTRCPLHATRRRAVPGEGAAEAAVMFIGEGPGFHEDQQGRPFVGAAGHFLEELLASVDLRREQVFITNVVKCRPPGNRDPEPEEVQACADYLERQIQALQPRLIVTLGRHSMARFLPGARISTVHGQARSVGGRLVVAMYHPAAALHQPSLRPVVVADFKRLPEWITAASRPDQAPGESPPPDEPEAQQLSLF